MINRIVLTLLVVSPQALASPQSDSLSLGFIAGDMMLRTVFGLVLIMSMIAAGAWLLRRLPVLRSGEGTIKTIAILNLGTREKLLVVEVDGVRLLLGISSAQIRTLHVFSANAEMSSVSFSEILQAAPKGADHEA